MEAIAIPELILGILIIFLIVIYIWDTGFQWTKRQIFKIIDVKMTSMSLLNVVGEGVQVRMDPFVSLLQKVGNRKLKIISINGKTRSGKSFIMSCFVHYLKSNRSVNWLNEMQKQDSEAFKWRRGVDPETKGISFYSEPFFVRDRSGGEEIAIILLDCQGAFDMQTSSNQNSLIFSFSSLLSSTFIYNIKENITENEIQPFLIHLNEALQAGSINGSGSFKSFQQLLILNRDVSSDYKLGHHTKSTCPSNEGRNLFLETFHPNPNSSTKEVLDSRALIMENYGDASIFALEYPGQGIRKDDISNLDPEFLSSATDLMQLLFSTPNLPPKLVNGSPVTGSQYILYFCALAATFNQNKLPKVESIFQAVAEKENIVIKQQAMAFFNNKMQQHASPIHGVASFIFEAKFRDAVQETQAAFNGKFIMGGPTLINKFQNELLTAMTASFQNFNSVNSNKIAAKVSADRIAAEMRAKVEAIRRQKELERIAEQERFVKDAIKQNLIANAESHLNLMNRQLEDAKGRLSSVNPANYYYMETVTTKHRNRVFGIVVKPTYSYSQVQRFNDARYNADLQAAQQAVQIAEQSVLSAKTNLESARNS